MRVTKGLVSLLTVTLLMVGMVAAWSADAPSAMSSAFQGIGARAMGMGNAFVSVADDSTALAWNPAGVRDVNRIQLRLGVTGQAQNLDTIQDLKDLADIAKNPTVDNIQQAFAIADRAAANPITLQASPYLAAGAWGIAVGGYGTVSGKVELAHRNGTVPVGVLGTPGNPEVDIDAAGLSLAHVGVGISKGMGDALTVGLAVKQVNAKYRAYTRTAELGTNGVDPGVNVAGGTLDESTISADLGFLYDLPEEEGVTLGVVIRNVNEPSFFTGGNAFDLRRQIDAGISFRNEDDLLLAVELHNMTAANNGGITFCLGAEKQLTGLLALRMGLQGGDWTGGFGIKLGPVQLDFATGSRLKSYASASMGLMF